MQRVMAMRTETFSRIIIHANSFVNSAHLFYSLTTLFVICYTFSQSLNADLLQISAEEHARRHFQSAEFLWVPLVPRYGRGNKPLFRRSDRKSAPELDRRRRRRKKTENSIFSEEATKLPAVTETNEENRGASVAEVLGSVKSQDASYSKLPRICLRP